MQKSALLSISLHIFLLFIFLFLKSEIELPDSEFAEIGFVSSTTNQRVKSSYPPPAQAVSKTSITEEKEDESEEIPQTNPAAQPKEESKAPPIDLPKVRMLENEESELAKRESGKLTPSTENTQLPIGEDMTNHSAGKELAEKSSGGKDFGNPTEGSAYQGRNMPGPTSTIGAPGGDMPFTIEGEAAKRNIITQVLPTYPSGTQREAVVKISFTVLPDGRIGRMIPVQKGDPVLEDITIKAMRQWRFSALPASEEQKNAQGIITFIYKLR